MGAVELVESAWRKLKDPDKKKEPITPEERAANACLHPSYAESRERLRKLIEEESSLEPMHFEIKEDNLKEAALEENSRRRGLALEYGLFFIDIYRAVPKKEGCWGCSRAIVSTLSKTAKTLGDRDIVATIDRNYGWLDHEWFSKNGVPYLLFSEDYNGGYGVLNLNTGEKSVYKPSLGGFCWSHMRVSGSAGHAAVLGCIWAAPYEIRIFRIPDDPMQLPWEDAPLTHEAKSLFEMSLVPHWTKYLSWERDDAEAGEWGDVLHVHVVIDLCDIDKKFDDEIEAKLEEERKKKEASNE